jgi:uncharacterized Tic20 family protein
MILKKTVSILVVLSKRKSKCNYQISCLLLEIEQLIIILTLLSIVADVCSIVLILTINIDKKMKRPSRRQRQSSKVFTYIFNVVNVEDLKSYDKSKAQYAARP